MEKLGIDGTLLIAQIVNFLIIAAVLTKVLYKPVISFVKKRQQEIDDGLALKDRMEKEKGKLEDDRQVVLKKARKEAVEITKQAKQNAQKKQNEMLAQVKEEIVKMRKQSQQQLDADQVQLEKNLSRQAVEIAEAMVNQLLSDVLTKKEQDVLISTQLSQLEKAYKNKN